jgi:hypothetical protein
MPITDKKAIARILFAETRDLEDTANPGDLTKIRGGLGALIRDSDNGVGFAAPVVPTVDDLAHPAVLAAWQDCTAIAANLPPTPLISSNPADVAIFSRGDPTKDTVLLTSYGWLAKEAPQPQLIGRAKSGGLDVDLYVTRAPTGRALGRYPRGGDRPVVQGGVASGMYGFASRGLGALLFIAVLAILILPAIFAGNQAFLPDDHAKRAEIVDARKVVLSRRNDLNAALKANETPTTETTKVVADAQQALTAAAADLAKAASGYQSLTWQWLVATLGLLLLLVVISWGLNRGPLGFLIDERGKMSLARFQFVAWMLTILGAYWIAAAWNVGTGYGDPGIDVPLPQMSLDLWILLGITVTSPLVSALILNVKAATPDTTSTDGSTTSGSQMPPQAPASAVGERGLLDVRTGPGTWSFLDMFTGEEVANRAAVDISRVQQFVFTLVALFAYLGLLATMFLKVTPFAPIFALPDISIYVVGLLAISHAAYLTAKSLPK